MSDCNFSYRHYRETLQAAAGQGYEFTTLRAWASRGTGSSSDGPDRTILLRHDVDRSVTKALCLAQIEAELGIAATYYVRLHSNYYNPFGHVAYRQIQAIRALGHEIGLHTEFWDAARIAGEDPLGMFRRELAVFDAVVGEPCHTYSLHRTTGSSDLADVQQAMRAIHADIGIPGAYDPVFQQDIKYLSDSSGIWREGCMCGHIGRHQRMQLLTHPDWWFGSHIELEEPLV